MNALASASASMLRANAESTPTPLRLVHNVGAITEEASGPTYSVVRLCDSLIEAGDAVTLMSLDWGAPGAHGPSYAKSFPAGAGPRRLGRSPAARRWLDAQASAGAIDVIHSHGLWLMTNVYPGWIAKRRGVPLVVSPRGAFTKYAMASGSRVKTLFWPLVQRPALAPAVCFHATCDDECEDIRRLGFRQPVAVIPNGVDLPPLAPRTRSERRTLLFLSRLHHKKGLDMLLPAWSRLEARFPDWELKIVGDDHGYHGASGHRAAMESLAARLGLARVAFEGSLYGAEKISAFRNADLYVLPTYSENFGMTVAEALSQETPAVVTKGAPWEGLVRHAAGWWTDIGVEPLAAALEQAMAQPRAALDAMGANGRAWMERDFQWGTIAAAMSETYRWLRDPSLPKPPCVRLDERAGPTA